MIVKQTAVDGLGRHPLVHSPVRRPSQSLDQLSLVHFLPLPVPGLQCQATVKQKKAPTRTPYGREMRCKIGGFSLLRVTVRCGVPVPMSRSSDTPVEDQRIGRTRKPRTSETSWCAIDDLSVLADQQGGFSRACSDRSCTQYSTIRQCVVQPQQTRAAGTRNSASYLQNRRPQQHLAVQRDDGRPRNGCDFPRRRGLSGLAGVGPRCERTAAPRNRDKTARRMSSQANSNSGQPARRNSRLGGQDVPAGRQVVSLAGSLVEALDSGVSLEP